MVVILFILKTMYRRLMRRSLSSIVLGRMKVPGRPQEGRFLGSDVELLLKNAWRNIDEMLPEAHLDAIPTIGNKHNVFLSVVSIGLYHALQDVGIERAHATELLADAGWKLYIAFLGIPKRIARIVTRDPQRQMNVILRMLLRFPFSADRFVAHWTWCPPFQFVKHYVEANGDRGEIEAFYRSWCWYDWSFTYAMMDGTRERMGYYERPHTLSQGDDVCDMCLSARVSGRAGQTLSH
jgi:hypothetical protein